MLLVQTGPKGGLLDISANFQYTKSCTSVICHNERQNTIEFFPKDLVT